MRHFALLFILLALLVPFYSVRPARATLTGSVCAVPSGQTNCSSNWVNGTWGQVVKVDVVIVGSDALNGFDVYVTVDRSILAPLSASLSGGLIQNPTVLAECISGISLQGGCTSTDLSMVHVAETTPPGTLTSAPTTGLLFSIYYKVVGGSSRSPIAVAASVTNGSPSFLPENVINGSFSEFADFTVHVESVIVSTTLGGTISTGVDLGALDGFVGTIRLTAIPTDPAVVAYVSPSIITFPNAGSRAEIFVNSNTTGTYYVEFVAASGGVKHRVELEATFSNDDFSLSASPAFWNYYTAIWATNLTLTNIRGYPVVSILSSGGNVNVSSATLSPGMSVPVLLTLTGAGEYNISAAYGRVIHYATVWLNPDATTTIHSSRLPECPAQLNTFSPTYVKVALGETENFTFQGIDQYAEAIFINPSFGYSARVYPGNTVCQAIVSITASSTFGGNHTLFLGEDNPLYGNVGMIITVDPPPLGDLNGDGVVNLTDCSMIALAYGSQTGDPHYLPGGDFDHDGYIGLTDVSIVFINYGAA